MSTQRVLLLCSHHLFGESMEGILRGAEGVHLTGPVGLEDDVHQHIASANPHVVVIADEEIGSHKAAHLTASLVEQYPEVLVIRVGLNQNTFRVFSTHTLPARVADLLDAIHNLPAAESLAAAHVSSRGSD